MEGVARVDVILAKAAVPLTPFKQKPRPFSFADRSPSDDRHRVTFNETTWVARW